MRPSELLAYLAGRGLRLSLHGDCLSVVPRSLLGDADRELIRAAKPELVEHLRADPQAQAEHGLEAFAVLHGLDWPAARSQMSAADVQGAALFLPLPDDHAMLAGWLGVLVRRACGERC